MALAWEGVLILCDRPGCGTTEQLPEWLPDLSPLLTTERWLESRAWTTIAGRHYCPEHNW